VKTPKLGIGRVGERGSAFKGRVFKISKIVEKILKCFTWFGCFRIFKSAEMVKKLPNTKSLPLKGGGVGEWESGGDAGTRGRGEKLMTNDK
jgi:hypothetical protein